MIAAVVLGGAAVILAARAAARRRRELWRALEIMADPPDDDPDELLAFQVAHGIYRCPPGCTVHRT